MAGRKKKPRADGDDRDPVIVAAAALCWEEVQTWKDGFPAGSIQGAKDVMVAVMAISFRDEKMRTVIQAGRVLAAIVQAEAAKLTAEKPITLILGEATAEDIGA